MPKKTKQKILRDEIQQDLIDQLERNGTVGTYYTDMITDYMKLWDTKNRLIADIEARGVTVESVTQAGTNIKRNDSVGDLLKTNAQMLKLLDSLGIRPAQTDGGGDAEM
ncbi:P27 family phage terminase small subunit [Caproiciproducens sp. CPB-2]|uniref:P27 family phage terminase small subunit n=1 Tax=Caproiciproducens sp. CPB-2 TaxID=3030017 RepID=UPI0023DB7BF8|nr:P27 family phage terminase small subunit [Caproiciproducens sp. CPB-2]MDF1495217.1 P27 family phage terminase small subunit [Caproiciproducens sp. CPB-2]